MTYRRAVVTFLDILGFSSLVETQPSEEIGAMLDAVGKTAASPIGDQGKTTSVLSFSDSVIRSRTLENETLYDALLHEIMDVATAQWTLLEYGLLIRGGTTIGDITIDESRAFGPAFVRAYKLESAFAGAPRIVIDPAVVGDIRDHLRSTRDHIEKDAQIADLRNHIRLGDDGIWFVDYVNSVSLLNDDAYVREALASMRRFIIDQVERMDPTALVLPKYLWLVRYHNQSVKRLFPRDTDLKIRSVDVPSSDEFLKRRRR